MDAYKVSKGEERSLSTIKIPSDTVLGLAVAVIVAVAYAANLDRFGFLSDNFHKHILFSLIVAQGFPGFVSFIIFYIYSRSIEKSFYVGIGSMLAFYIVLFGSVIIG